MSDMAQAYLGQAISGDRDHWSGPPEMVEGILDAVPTRRGDVVLDVGAGLGGPAHRLAELTGCRVVAIDILPDVLVQAKRRARRSDGDEQRVWFVGGSAEALPLPSGSVDRVWSLGVLAHLTDLERFAGEVFRVLRSNGVLVATEGFWVGDEPPRFAQSAPQPWRAVRTPTFTSALAAAGLVQIEARPWPGHQARGALEATDPLLRADLADGRLVPIAVLARRP